MRPPSESSFSTLMRLTRVGGGCAPLPRALLLRLGPRAAAAELLVSVAAVGPVAQAAAQTLKEIGAAAPRGLPRRASAQAAWAHQRLCNHLHGCMLALL